jgi:hypothetical protein
MESLPLKRYNNAPINNRNLQAMRHPNGGASLLFNAYGEGGRE